MVQGINANQVNPNVEVPQKKKSGAGSTIIGTVAATGLGAAGGYFASNALYDKFIKEAEAAIAHPSAVKAEMIEAMNKKGHVLDEGMIDRSVSSIIKTHEENIPKLKSSKNKWIAGAAVVTGAIYLGCKVLFGKKEA